MELVIPDGAQVHITVGHPPLLALPDESRAITATTARPRGRLGKALLAGIFLIGAFEAGRTFPHHADATSAAQPPAVVAGSGVAEDRDAGEIPRAFRDRIEQAPQVVPPPGAASVAPTNGSTGSAGVPAAAPTQANPFGLHG